MSQPKVRVCAQVPEDLRELWVSKFGEYASFSWLLEHAMRGMLAAVAPYPSKEEILRQAIRSHIDDLADKRAQPQRAGS
jgi:Ribonuclease G/E